MNAPRWREERGVALVAVLWFIVAAAGLALSFVRHGQADLIEARGQLDSVQARALIDAGVARGVAEIARAIEGASPLGGLTVELDGGRVEVHVESESGKIDLNTADRQLVAALARAVEIPADRADEIGDAVVDWRDDNDLRQPNGAELSDYQGADSPWQPPNLPFKHVDELRYLLPIDQAAADLLAPFVTVYTGLAAPESYLAPKPVRDAMELRSSMPQDDKSGQDGGPLGDDGSAGEEETAGASSRGTYPGAFEQSGGSPDGDQAEGVGTLAQNPKQVYSLWLMARLANGYVRAARVVVWLNLEGEGRPFRILDWAPTALPAGPFT